jgi:hypothetical protein
MQEEEYACLLCMLCGNHVQHEAACSVHVDVDVVETHPHLHLTLVYCSRAYASSIGKNVFKPH